jgi:hypothetical protein
MLFSFPDISPIQQAIQMSALGQSRPLIILAAERLLSAKSGRCLGFLIAA